MQKHIRLSLTIGLCLAAQPCLAQTPFVHPGSHNTRTNLDFVKSQIRLEKTPWREEFKEILVTTTEGAPLRTHINARDDNQAEAAKAEVIKAYSNALAWYYTGEDVYEHQAISILNTWSGFEGFTSGTDQDRLLAGWLGAILGQAAEIMRLSPKWSETDRQALKSMFKRAFYPQLNTASTWNGNVDLTQIDAIMSLAVFNDDHEEFALGLKRLEARIPSYFYLRSDQSPRPIAGDGNDIDAFWSHPKLWVDGLTQETCRDNGHHAQFALASALHAAEIAWNQGVDIYSQYEARYTTSMELLAQQLMNGEMQGICVNNIATQTIYDTWEIGYHHFHTRKGITLPFTKALITNRLGGTRASDWNIFHETLTHGNLPR